MSNHACVVYQFNYNETRELADTTSLNAWDIPDSGYTYILNRNDWANYRGLVAFCLPDTLVPIDSQEFSFLSKDAKYHKDSSGKGNIDAGIPKYARIKARKFRNYLSYGLLAKIPESAGLKPGDDATEYLGLSWYNPEVASVGDGSQDFCVSGDMAVAPSGVYYKYDVENGKKWAKNVFIPGELCLVTVKLNGSSSRFVYKDGVMNVGSRETWKKEFTAAPNITFEELLENMRNRLVYKKSLGVDIKEELGTIEARAKEVFETKVINFKSSRNTWWTLLDHHPQIEKFCKENEGYCLYGEMYGYIGGYRYNVPPGQVRFAAFDILRPDGTWIDAPLFLESCLTYEIPTVPVVAQEGFDLDKFLAYADIQDNLLPGSTCTKEGVCIKPWKERYHEKLGRVHVKFISKEYSLKG